MSHLHKAMLAVLLLSLSHLSMGGESATKVIKNKNLGISTSIPASWKCSGEESLNCMSPNNDDNGVEIILSDKSLEEVLSGDDSYKKIDCEWWFENGSNPVAAKKIQADDWRGIYTVVLCGISGPHGQGRATGECSNVIISNGYRTATIQAGGATDTEVVLQTLVKNFKFIDKLHQ